MWRLCIEDDEANRTIVNLVRKEYTIGRAEENAVRLTERNVSRRHAVLRRTNEGWVFEDLHSETGSFVNERRVDAPLAIEHRDKVRIGDYDITLLDSEKEAEEAAADKQSETVPASVESDRSVERHDRLVVLEGPNPGTQYPLIDKKILIGRGEECDLTIADTSVSRVHASLMRDEHGRFHVSDQKSSNGVRVNGMEITKIPLYAGDIVELGDVHLQFVPKGSRFDENALRPSASARPVPNRSSVSNKLWVGLGLLGIVGGVIWFGSQKRRADEATAVAGLPTANLVDSVLDQAEVRLNSSDTDAALALLQSIPNSNPLKLGPRYRSLVNAWADQQLQKISLTNDTSEKSALLEQLIGFRDIGPKRLTEAREQLRLLNAAADVDAGSETEAATAPSATHPSSLPSAAEATPPTTTVALKPAVAPAPKPTPRPAPVPKPAAAAPAPSVTAPFTPASPTAQAPVTQAPTPTPSVAPAPQTPAPSAPPVVAPAPSTPAPLNSPPVVTWPGATP
jgi:pSer/pThr/pTyr-binding forkhead associated (FHA) protein